MGLFQAIKYTWGWANNISVSLGITDSSFRQRKQDATIAMSTQSDHHMGQVEYHTYQ